MRFFILILLSLAVSAIGFHKYVWFISLGYGFSVAAIGITLFVMFPGATDPLSALFRILLIAYGLRLGGYLAYREIKSASYNKLMQKEIKGNSQVSLGARIAIWVSVGILYPVMAALFPPRQWRRPQRLGLDRPHRPGRRHPARARRRPAETASQKGKPAPLRGLRPL